MSNEKKPYPEYLQDYLKGKEKQKEGELLLLHGGAFHYAFFDDARQLSQLLGLRLTKAALTENVDLVPAVAIPYHEVYRDWARVLSLGLPMAVLRDGVIHEPDELTLKMSEKLKGESHVH